MRKHGCLIVQIAHLITFEVQAFQLAYVGKIFPNKVCQLLALAFPSFPVYRAVVL